MLYLKMSVIPKLRGHHLICLHFFNGRGYNREFTENLRRVLEQAENLGVEVSVGADDVCRECPYMRDKKCCSEDHSNQEIIEMDEFAMKLLKEASDSKLGWNALKEKIPSIFHLWLERYCKRCCWTSACEENLYYLRLRDGKNTF
ncbi:MAG: DUF1284 domain-containing protein [Nitrospirota bacterium]|nr:DUF1284 domain-containing protein [Nitrospirota bacterium]